MPRAVRSIRMLLVLLVTGLAPGACADREGVAGTDEAALSIAVSVPPLAWIARGLAPEGARVTTLIPPGASPHGWEMTPSQAGALREADLVLLVGLGLDASVESAIKLDADGRQRVLRFGDVAGETSDAAAHDHDAVEEHGHAHGADPHLWLDPALMAAFVSTAHDRLLVAQQARGDLDDAERARLAGARDALLREVEAVRAEHADALAPHAGAGLITAHEAWGRLADAFGLRVVGALRRRGEVEPAPGAASEAVEAARSGLACVIVVEPQMRADLARRVAAETGAAIATLDPLGSGDWPATMRANLDALLRALEESEPSA